MLSLRWATNMVLREKAHQPNADVRQVMTFISIRPTLHSKDTKFSLLNLILPSQCSSQPQSQHSSSVTGRNDTVIPQPCTRVSDRTLILDRILQLWINGLAYSFHDSSQLFAAHDSNLCIWPHPHESWRVCSSAHCDIVSICARSSCRKKNSLP